MQLGINNISNSAYHANSTFISSSGYKKLLEDPALFYKENVLGQREAEGEKEHLQFGSLLHTMLLEPHLVQTEYAVFPGLRRAGKEFEAFKAENVGKYIVTKAKMEEAKWLIRGVHKSEAAQSLLKLGGVSEETVAVNLNGVPTKCRADKIVVNEGLIWDLKSTSWDLDIDSVKQTIAHWDYALSASLYCAVFEEHYKRKFDFMWVFINKGSADCAVYKMSEKTRADGLQKVAKAQALYKQCMSTGLWLTPEKKLNYSDEIQEI